MSEFLILALDPGGTTGFAYGIVEPGSGFKYVDCDQRKMDEAALWVFLHGMAPDVLVTESFEYRGAGPVGISLVSRNLIGVMGLYCAQIRIPLHSQMAAEGKAHYTNNNLKKAGAYKVGKEHARDATRHLLHFMNFGAGYRWTTKSLIK